MRIQKKIKQYQELTHRHLTGKKLNLAPLLKKGDMVALHFLLDVVEKNPVTPLIPPLLPHLQQLNLSGNPEGQSLLAKLYLMIIPHYARCSLPEWQKWEPSSSNARKWRLLEILNSPEKELSPPADMFDYHALKSVSIKDIPPITSLLKAMINTKDPHIQKLALSWIEPFILKNSSIILELSTLVKPLLESNHSELLLQTINLLHNPAFTIDPALLIPLRKRGKQLPKNLQRKLIDLFQHNQQGDQLQVILKDPDIDPVIRRYTLSKIGSLAPAYLIDDLIALTEKDPLFFTPPLFETLNRYHRRGIFIQKNQIAPLITLVLNGEIAPEQFDHLTYIHRNILHNHYEELLDQREIIPKLIELIAYLPQPLPLLKKLLISYPGEMIQRKILPLLGCIENPESEQLLLYYMDQYPDITLDPLYHCGGELTRERLYTILIEENRSIPINREGALTLLWHLSTPQQQITLLEQLNPEMIPQKILSYLQPHYTKKSLEILLKHYRNDLQKQIISLAQTASVAAIPLLKPLIHHLIIQLNQHPEHYLINNHQKDIVFPEELKKSVILMGKNLHLRGVIRPASLIADTPEIAGDQFLSNLLIELMIEKKYAPGAQQIILKTLLSLKKLYQPERITHLIHSKHPEVRKVAIQIVVKLNDPGFIPTFLKLLKSKDIETIRQSLIALGDHTPDQHLHLIIQALEHPNMNIKKTAIGILKKSRNTETIPPLLFWLGYHENSGFRMLLLDALSSIAAPYLTPLLLNTISKTTEIRSKKLLTRALDRKLSLGTIKQLLLKNDDTLYPVVSALATSTILPEKGTIQSLIPLFKQYGFSPENQQKHTAVKKNYFPSGWDPKIAISLLHQLPPEIEIAPVVKKYLREWLYLLADKTLPNRGKLLFTLNLNQLQDREITLLVDQLNLILELTDQNRPKLIKLLTMLIPEIPRYLYPFIIQTVKNLETSQHHNGLLRFQLLEKLNTPLTIDDIVMLLHDCRHSSDAIKQMEELLYKLFYPESERDPLKDLIKTVPHQKPEQWPDLIKNLIKIRDHIAPEVVNNHEGKEHYPGETQLKLLREKLNTTNPEISQKTVKTLLKWPVSIQEHTTFLQQFLSGKLKYLEDDLSDLKKAFQKKSPEEILKWVTTPDEISQLLKLLEPEDTRYYRILLEWWHTTSESSEKIRNFLSRIDNTHLFHLIFPRLQKQQWGYIKLIREKIASNHLTGKIVDLLRKDGAETWLELFQSKLKPSLLQSNAATIPPKREIPAISEPEIITPEKLRSIIQKKSLKEIKEAVVQTKKSSDPEITALLKTLINHKNSEIRTKVYRLLKTRVSRREYCELTLNLLTDSRSEIRCAAIKTLTFTRHTPAIPDLIKLLRDKNQKVSDAARAGLIYLGEEVLNDLYKQLKRARPDKKKIYREIIELIEDPRE